MKQNQKLLLLALAMAAAVAASGWAALLFAILGLFLVLGIAMVQISSMIIAHRPYRMPRKQSRDLSRQPLVSIHVPCCNEPPEVVIGTLDALHELDWSNYEVICLDNNTEDAAVWAPLEAHCRKLGPRFRSYHEADVSDAKAGALNLALQRTDRSAEYVAVVDADYRVKAHFLHCAHAWLTDKTGRAGSGVAGFAPLLASASLVVAGTSFALKGLSVAALGAFTGAVVFSSVLELATQLYRLRTA